MNVSDFLLLLRNQLAIMEATTEEMVRMCDTNRRALDKQIGATRERIAHLEQTYRGQSTGVRMW